MPQQNNTTLLLGTAQLRGLIDSALSQHQSRCLDDEEDYEAVLEELVYSLYPVLQELLLAALDTVIAEAFGEP